jgi:tRNA (guanine26-N2/guanine27-N2)-dimethyltransferase
MWLGPLHDSDFVSKVLEHVDSEEAEYGTKPRMKGMLTLAKAELTDPLCFTPSKIASSFQATAPAMTDFV